MSNIKAACVSVAGLALAFGSTVAHAQSEAAANTLKIGYAEIGFNTKSDDLVGLPGTTPPGIQTHLRNTRTLALVYERKISGPWSVVVQAGAPPLIKFDGAGAGAALGRVGTARAWFPAVLATYTVTDLPGIRPYVGAGVNYTSFANRHVSAGYTGAFGGTGSSSKLKDSWGPVVKLGAEIPIAKNWMLDMAYSRYWIDTRATLTTTTPGVGDIARTIDVKVDPGVFSLMVGYRF
ncbi:OmpW [Sphingomonas sp. SKA58]|uniref:OmpW/AlkL family protein n=1 Tax=Sphingomonas sp. (strain SKA58) TaxID=314266 RepID=UPI0000D7AE45|nr:OmpW family outer membrane protein [Sphingomonas sp. SKA58]EAT07129.1 OmpW [Sphingomonas sp. SKA58]|tara:strand:- start:6440 stop:7144 length:705 start_codon:yes stop_codon:yes gene_type:complete